MDEWELLTRETIAALQEGDEVMVRDGNNIGTVFNDRGELSVQWRMGSRAVTVPTSTWVSYVKWRRPGGLPNY